MGAARFVGRRIPRRFIFAGWRVPIPHRSLMARSVSSIPTNIVDSGRGSMTNPLVTDVRKTTTWSIVLSVLMIVAGVLAISMPLVGGIAVAALVGWLLVFSGMLHFAFAWRSGTAGAVLWEILLGIAYGAVGLYNL